MNLRSSGLLALGGALFFVGALLLLLWMGGGPGFLLVPGLVLLPISAVVMTAGGRAVAWSWDALEIRRERQLWTSGPMGRWWLARRRRRP